MSATRVLVVDDNDLVARALAAMVEANGHSAVVCNDVESAFERFDQLTFDAVVSDVKMGVLGGFDLLRGVKQRQSTVPVVLITGEATVSAAMEAMDEGAYDYLSKPVRPEALGQLLRRAIEHKRLLAREGGIAAAAESPPPSLTDIIGRSPLMLEAFKNVARAARGDANVLILGENGTGKEMVARALHEKSDRSEKPFVAVNVAAIAPGVAESELFGHVRGAFTDARETRQGLFQQAHGGTLFLDEIGDLEPALQAKLLRAIQERCIKPVGGNDEIEVDIRLVSATNRDLGQRVREGRFRQDLYYRINVVSISLPPLRERLEDVPQLSEYFLARFAARAGRRVPRLTSEALDVLLAHPWPGNVRELENVMQRVVQFCTDGLVTPDLLMIGETSPAMGPAVQASAARRQLVTLKEKMEQYVLEVLSHTGGNLTQAARILDISRRTIQRMAARRRTQPESGDILTHTEQN
jgi:DNA-binding NtrC family response regulator